MLFTTTAATATWDPWQQTQTVTAGGTGQLGPVGIYVVPEPIRAARPSRWQLQREASQDAHRELVREGFRGRPLRRAPARHPLPKLRPVR